MPDLAAMQRLGDAIAANFRVGDVVALSGGLGAGKTTLARAIIAALGHAGEVPSPSFSIVEVYDEPALRVHVVMRISIGSSMQGRRQVSASTTIANIAR